MPEAEEPVEELIDRWSAVARSLRHLAVSLLDLGTLELKTGSLSQPNVFAAALLSRTIGNLKSTFILIQSGMAVEARTLTRCCIENLLWMRRLATEGEGFVQKIVDDTKTQDIAFAKTILPLPVLEFLDDEDVRHLRSQAGAKRTGTISPSDNIADEQTREDYLLFKLLSGDAAHPSARSLSWHIPRNDETGVTEFHVEPPLYKGAVEDILYYSCGALVKVMALHHQMFPSSGSEQIVLQAAREVEAMGGPDDPAP